MAAVRLLLAPVLLLAPAAALRLPLRGARPLPSGGAGLRTPAAAAAPALPSDAFSADFGPRTACKEDWASAYRNVEREETYAARVEGTLPASLLGTLYRNGPGRIERGGHAYAHLFDGDGMLIAFRFGGDGAVTVTNRFVRTPEYEAEEAAGRVLYRNTFGTQPRGGMAANFANVLQKNVANTNVVSFGGRLLALWEAAQPYRLDPASLETLGLETFGGLLQPGMPFTTGLPALDALLPGLVGDPLSAHPKVDRPGAGAADAARGARLVTYGYRAKPSAAALLAGRGAFDSELMVYEFDEGWRAKVRRPVNLDGFAFVHDFVVTEHYLLWFQNPTGFEPLPFVLGQKNPAQLIEYDGSKPTLVHVVPRDPADARRAQRTLRIPACFVFHHARGFEASGAPGEETLVVDSVVLTAFPSFDELTRAPDDDGAALLALDFSSVPINRVQRFTIDLAEPDAERAVAAHTPRPRAVEFPTVGHVAPRAAHRYVFGACAAHATLNAPFQGVCRIDMESGEEVAHFPGPRRFVNEPVFVPKPGAAAEDDGWLLVVVHDAEGGGGDAEPAATTPAAAAAAGATAAALAAPASAGRAALYVYDAARLDAGPEAVVWLRTSVPYGLHGTWVGAGAQE